MISHRLQKLIARIDDDLLRTEIRGEMRRGGLTVNPLIQNGLTIEVWGLFEGGARVDVARVLRGEQRDTLSTRVSEPRVLSVPPLSPRTAANVSHPECARVAARIVERSIYEGHLAISEDLGRWCIDPAPPGGRS